MKLTGSFSMAAAEVDVARRRIIGKVVPFGEVGYPKAGGEPVKLLVEAGGLTWDNANQIKLVIDHDGDKKVFAGKARDLVQTKDGIVGTFSILKTAAGDQALEEAHENVRDGFSWEADYEGEPPKNDDGVYVINAEHSARLTYVCLVENPAFATARVTEIAASKETKEMTNTVIESAEVPDGDLAKVTAALGEVTDTLKGFLPSEDGDKEETTKAEAGYAARIPAVANHLTASTSVKREPFPYGHPGAEGSGFFSDMVAAKRGDTLAAARVDKAEGMWQIAAADEAAAMSDVTIPNVYDDALMVKLPEWPRVIADNVPSTNITSARPILVPRFDGFVADGGSGEPVTAHTENANPTSAEIDIDYATYTPLLYSGKIDISREAVDAGSPGMDQILFSALRRSYNNVTELAAYTAIVGFSGIDTGSSTTDASPAVEAQNMVSTIITEMAAFTDRCGYPADIIWANPTQFGLLTGLNATDGRPILPYTGPSNTVGTGVQANHGVVPIQGVPMYNAHAVASAKVVLASSKAIHKWESPLLSFRWEEVAGPAKIRFVAAGYHLTSVLDKNGVDLITQA